jgi:subtilisin family serine protease
MNWISRIVVLIAMAVSGWGAEPLIVRAAEGYMQELAARFGLTIQKRIPGQDVYLVQGPAGVTTEQLIAALKNYDYGKEIDNDDDDDDDVDAEADIFVYLAEGGPGAPRLITNTGPVAQAVQDPTLVNFHGTPAWTGFVNQEALTKIRLPQAQSRFGVRGPTVAVIDTGIDPYHPLLQGALVPGYDFVRDRAGMPNELDDLDADTRSILNPYTTAILDTFGEANPYTTAILDQYTASRLDPSRLPPQFGHGTMVAGLVRRVAPGAKIMPLKPFGGDGRARLFHLLESIYYAVDNGAKVLNLSLSLAEPTDELQRAVEYAAQQGAVLVGSAGNSGLETMVYPAGYKQVIGVASTDLNDQASVFTNHGDNLVRIAAPGEGLVTLYPGGRYAAGWGTSFSAPLVSGTVALMAHWYTGLNWEKAEDGVKEAAPVDGNLGDGRLDVFRAVRKAREF